MRVGGMEGFYRFMICYTYEHRLALDSESATHTLTHTKAKMKQNTAEALDPF